MPGVDIRRDDEIQVIHGKDRGTRGRVVRVLPRERRIMVEGIARAKKHARPSKQRQQGGIIDIEQFIDISNVQIVCKSCGQPTRVGHRVEDGKRVRICRKCEADL
ncbi:MAG TPA: 50S ribosomal protein L24 [Actinomycetota bacterium]|nr:50S ribosomal protein L24 [Actinomycetota bacterium]